jgi:hypothetical protein
VVVGILAFAVILSVLVARHRRKAGLPVVEIPHASKPAAEEAQAATTG